MADVTPISKPVQFQSDSKYRVAFDLMEKIATSEVKAESNTREYWIRLYRQCYKVLDDCAIASSTAK